MVALLLRSVPLRPLWNYGCHGKIIIGSFKLQHSNTTNMVLEEVDSPLGFPGHLDGEQTEKLKSFQQQMDDWRAQHPQEGLTSTGRTDAKEMMHLKFLRARGFNVKVAFDLYTTNLLWGVKFQDIGVKNLTMDMVANEIHSGKCFAYGTDLDGRPCTWVRVGLHKKSKSDSAELERYMAWFFDKSKLTLKPPIETATVVIDLSGISMDSLDMTAARNLSDMLGQRYPESLGYGLLVDAPWIFSAFWKVLKPFIDPRTIKKIQFVSRKDLSKFVAPEQTPTLFGGTAEYTQDKDPVLTLSGGVSQLPPKKEDQRNSKN
ncbi:hypothetical protein PROFUN_10322 [Planoprotostelium fungivorum]|uniref:CRAL-TRIO domain-containing protein n=1 Tax=Planoprotostelium fungivorum TaxID=1890364 RepID=A0A2P6NDS6_9EUKA|nr:hypothetical protein PROFUN_10322 [Planoprotostelium fungivorum]